MAMSFEVNAIGELIPTVYNGTCDFTHISHTVCVENARAMPYPFDTIVRFAR